MIFAREYSIPGNHPSIPDHFPGNPVVPGAVVLDIIRDSVEEYRPGTRITAIPYVKFMGALLPEKKFQVVLKANKDLVSFECLLEGNVVVRGEAKVGDVTGL